MPSKIKTRARAFLSRFVPTEHVPLVFNNNVHDLARIGGVSVLSIPAEYSPCDLVIPTRFAATAQFLVDAGLESTNTQAQNLRIDESWRHWPSELATRGTDFNIPGLFRIPGSKVTTERLRAYFERQMYDGGGTFDGGRNSSDIEYTVRLGTLPNQNVVPYQIHDVASCFKSFLADLDGGILGSLDTFEGLRKVVMPLRAPRQSSESADLEWRCIGISNDHAEDDVEIDANHIARILCSIPCAASRNLVLAVFGLLAFFMADDSPFHESYQREASSGIPILDEMRDSCFPVAHNEVRMTADALGRIFAPLLLGEELTQQVNMDISGRPTSGSRYRRSQTPSPRKRNTLSPDKCKTGRLHQRTSWGSNKTDITINIHPHPLHSHPALPQESQMSAVYCHGNSFDSSKIELLEKPQNFSSHGGNVSAESFKRLHKGCSFPSLTTASGKSSGASKRSSKRDSKTLKTMSMLHDQQARILLIATVITRILRKWREVCLELRMMGYGKGDSAWRAGSDEMDSPTRSAR